MSCSVYLGLVHYPIYNRSGDIITTAVTNFDIHDIARAACTYGVKNYFIVHPLQGQKDLVCELLEYWQVGFGSTYNPDRCTALSTVQVIDDIAGVIDFVESIEGVRPCVVTTDARRYDNSISYKNMRELIERENFPLLLLFGTGFGIEKSVMQEFDYILEPVCGPTEYNHLSVRSAVSIILDRLLGI